MNDLMPAIFIGHGNPMNALTDNEFTRKWVEFAARAGRPKAILCVSAHWYIPDTRVTAMASPRTIHDFGGFPKELYKVEYPAPGDLKLAKRVKQLLKPVTPVGLDKKWGLDHGTWSILCRAFPEAKIPVVQLSVNMEEPPEFHYELGKKLAPLRKEGVLVIGSGNVVHNLMAYAWGERRTKSYEWAVKFNNYVKVSIAEENYPALLDYKSMGEAAELSVPTPDHYLPLLYIAGMHSEDEGVSFPVTGFDGGSISMLAAQTG